MYRHERSLVKQLADKPFVLIGVNSDQGISGKNLQQLRETIKKKNLTWRSFQNENGKDGVISEQFFCLRVYRSGSVITDVMSLKRKASLLTHFADLSPHTYSNDVVEDTVLNIGWLCGTQSYETGATSIAFRNALDDLVSRPVILHRDAHRCNLGCAEPNLGNGQIRVLGKDQIWYSAPTLVHHYVVCHDYRPPDRFVSAVLDGIAVMIEPDRIPYWPR